MRPVTHKEIDRMVSIIKKKFNGIQVCFNYKYCLAYIHIMIYENNFMYLHISRFN